MTSHDDIYRKIRTNHRKAKARDKAISRRAREQNFQLRLLAQRVKVLYVQISALGALLAGDIVAHYFK
jgi:hypothetical protein